MEPKKPDPAAARSTHGGAADRRPGLCEVCRHVRTVTSARGAVFLMCRRSSDDPRFPKYPPQPVVACVGFERSSDGHGDPVG